MTGPGDHRRWRADLAAYLLGSLEAEENEALEKHLEECQRCREELRWLQPAIDLLPESVPRLEPSPELRARLLAEVRADAPAGAAAPPAREPARPGPVAGLRRFLLRPAVALTAAVAIAAVIAAYSLGGGGGGGEETTTVVAEGQNQVRATLERSGDSGTLQLTGLRQAPSSHVYQAWVQHDRRIEPSSLFDTRRNGTANTAIPHGLEDADAVMVTIEPRGGSAQPSASPVVALELRD